MGLLDEAIREHLELKRLHGADAGEVARQEHEALGPVRREDIAIPNPGSAAVVPKSEPLEPPVAHEEPTVVVARPAPEPGAPAPLAAPEPAPYALDVDQPTVSFSLEDHQAAQPAAPSPAAAPAPAPSPPAPVAPIPAQEEPLWDARPAPSPEPSADPPRPRSTPERSWDAPTAPPAALDPAPVAPDVVPADDEPGEHDELEETPEFLQETPEHDRLWFEQKPPRDFDF